MNPPDELEANEFVFRKGTTTTSAQRTTVLQHVVELKSQFPETNPVAIAIPSPLQDCIDREQSLQND
jgi:hypothetical protein